MTRTSVHPVVVAVDGSPASDRALRWAVDEAARQRLPLHVVHAHVRGETDVLDDARAAVDALAPGLTARYVLTEQPPGWALVGASAEATCVVVGSRGPGAVAALLLGSVAAEVVQHARCPVVVVKDVDDPERPRDGVVVGVDGTTDAQPALAYAFAQASRRSTSLDVVHAWSTDRVPVAAGLGEVLPASYRFEQEEELVVSETLAGWRERYPDVEVRVSVVHAAAVQALLDHAEGAQLLVVGSRGRGGFAGLLLGSVSQALARTVASPVAVVR
ncbi:universal stress protein [Angustibacter peucedani]